MGTRLYVGNIPYNTNDGELRALFSQNGRTVTDTKIVTDRETGQSRGFAFVEMSNADEAQAAINELNGAFMGGRAIRINEARERTPGGPPGGGGAPRPGGFSGPPRPGGFSGPPRPGGFGPPRPGGFQVGGPPRPGGANERPGERRPDKDQGRRRNHDRDRAREKIRDDIDDDY
jgi:RNA recognition motif-containing protein